MYQTLPGGRRVPLVGVENDYATIESTVNAAVRDYFISDLGRPEILNRIGNNLVVFDFIRPEAVELILRKQISSILSGIADSRGITVKLEETTRAWQTLVALAGENLEFGGRGIGNAVEKYLLNPLARALTDQNWQSGDTYVIEDILIDEDGVSLIAGKQE